MVNDTAANTDLRRFHYIDCFTFDCIIGFISENVIMPLKWKDISNYEGIYKVSSNGDIKSLKRIVYHPKGDLRIRERLLKKYVGNHGYEVVTLHKDSKVKVATVHYLVAEAFIGQRPSSRHEICHKNGIKTENRLRNLMYGTYEENNMDKVRHNTLIYGERHPCSKISINQAIDIYLNKNNESNAETARKFNLSSSSVSSIRRGENWRRCLIKCGVIKDEG